MRCPKTINYWFILLLCILACKQEVNPGFIQLNESNDTTTNNKPIKSNEVEHLDGLLSGLMLKRDFGHVVFSVPEDRKSGFVALSLEQPDAKIEKVGENLFVITNLFPQKHTVVISHEIDSETVYAVFRDLEIEAGSYVEVGMVPFEKAGGIQGRFLAAHSSQPLAEVSAKIVELGVSVKANSAGEFDFSSLPAGRWRLSAVSNQGDTLRGSWIEVVPGQQTNIGDLWLGQNASVTHAPILLNGIDNITSDSKLKIKLKLPQGARFVTVRSKDGEVFLSRVPARETIDVKLNSSTKTMLEILIMNDSGKLMGIMNLPVEYDPFSIGGNVFYPSFEIDQRVSISPSRTFDLRLVSLPAGVAQVRVAVNGIWSEWKDPLQNIRAELPKMNTNCGENSIAVQFQNSSGHESKSTEMPVTLSCWERIVHRAATDKIVGLKNAATWTGTHAFVWSGRQQKFDVELSSVGSANSAESISNLKELQKYVYLDGGYIFQPEITSDGLLGRTKFEYIVTDNAPTPRASAGIGSRNHLVAVYGGENGQGPLADGSVYNINTNGWVSMMGDGAPSPRIKPHVFFIDDHRILVWGGSTRTSLGYEISLNDGGIYDFKTHRWKKIDDSQAPSPRIEPVVVWSGSELFVIGGTVPGRIDANAVSSAAKYDPQSDAWSTLPVSIEDIMMMSGRYVDGHIIMFGNDNQIVIFRVSDNTITYSHQYEVNRKLNVNPSLVLVGDGRGTKASLLYIFGGQASYVDSDANAEIMILPYKTGIIDESDTRKTSKSNITAGFTVNGREMYNCCTETLGFSINDSVFMMNGTATRNLSIYTIDDDNVFSDEEVLSSRVFTQEKSYQSVVMRYHPTQANSVLWTDFDVTSDFADNNMGVYAPYHLFSTTPPVWSEGERSLFWYGGVYMDRELRQDLQGGWMYKIDQKAWVQLPVSAAEPAFIDRWNNNFKYSRMLNLNFFLGGALHTIGGYHRIGEAGGFVYRGYESLIVTDDILFNAFKTPIVNQIPNTPVATFSDDLDEFDFLPMSHSHALIRWDLNAPCVVGDSVLFSGGRRRFERNQPDFDQSRALLQDKLVYDGNTGELRRIYHDSLGVRAGVTVVSNGSQCFLWGGYKADLATFSTNAVEATKSILSHYSPQRSGALFTPANDLWQQVSSEGAPSERSFMHGVWTGSEFLLWGGRREFLNSISKPDQSLKGVWQYSPSRNSWTSLPSVEGEPAYKGVENPIWTGRYMLIWQAENSQYNVQFNPKTNTWQRLKMPYGFGYRTNQYWDNHLVWTGQKLLVMPITEDGMALMALYVPPDP